MEYAWQFIQSARNSIKEKRFEEAEHNYLDAIKLLGDLNEKESNLKTKSELWTTQAEYYWFNANLLKDNLQENHKYALKAIALLLKTSKLDNKFGCLNEKIKQIIDKTILRFGCIIPETNEGMLIACPIKISTMGAGQFGFSPAFFIKEAECSICGKNILDDSCGHIPGETYEGKQCLNIIHKVDIDHIALVKNPKDPNAKITALTIPKSEFFEGFSEEELKLKEKHNLPIICSHCKLNKRDPTEINVKKFFEMQKIDLDGVLQ